MNERKPAETDPELFCSCISPRSSSTKYNYAPELFVYIKLHADKSNNPGDFWLTGSRVFKLMRGARESLAGCGFSPNVFSEK